MPSKAAGNAKISLAAMLVMNETISNALFNKQQAFSVCTCIRAGMLQYVLLCFLFSDT